MLYSVFVDDVANNIDLIDKIKSFFQEQHPTIDFVVFTDNILYATTNHSILSTFYIIAYSGAIVFLDMNNYLTYKDQIKGQPILYLNQDYISTLDRNTVKHCTILTENNNKLEWIKNYEL